MRDRSLTTLENVFRRNGDRFSIERHRDDFLLDYIFFRFKENKGQT